MLQDKVSMEKLDKYQAISEKALSMAKKNIARNKQKQALEIIKMVECYLQDSIYFKKTKNLVNSFAAINYAHGWLDTGVRLGIFNVKDSRLFVVK